MVLQGLAWIGWILFNIEIGRQNNEKLISWTEVCQTNRKTLWFCKSQGGGVGSCANLDYSPELPFVKILYI